MRNAVRFVVIATLLAVSTLAAQARIDARLFRYADVSATQIAFVYAGDIWLVPKGGGTAVQLSTPPGEEAFPRFSPDGSLLAYSADYDGNSDIYVVPVTGGIPIRVTHHPDDDRMLDWYPDGQSILFASGMASPTHRFRQLYRVSKDGGLPEKLPVPYGEFGAISEDGKTLAYATITRDFRTWKRYRGGMAPDIWLFDLERKTSKNVNHDDANDGQPMWHGTSLYILSDRGANKRCNIWKYDTIGGAFTQLTSFDDFDVHFPAIGPDDIVFENGGKLYLLDLATEKFHEVTIEVVTDRATLKPRTEKVDKLIRYADISPSGKRAVLGARGEVFTVPVEHGPVKDLTRTSGVAERSPAWSPDGKSIAYFTDRNGEYELAVRPSDGSGEERIVTKLGPGFRYAPFWSPDSGKIAFIDQAMRLQLVEVANGKTREIDRGVQMDHGDLQQFRVRWSADSRFMAYAFASEANIPIVTIFDTTTFEKHRVTSGTYAAMSPVFDPDGKYLYLLTSRTFAPVYGDLDTTWIYPNTTGVAAIPLRADVPSPLAARDDEEKGEEAAGDKKDGDKKGKDEKKKDGGKDEKKPAKPEPVKIDFDGFEARLVVLPAVPGNYAELEAAPGKVIYRRLPFSGSPEKGRTSPVLYYDLEEREEKTILPDVESFCLSADGKKLLVAKDKQFAIVDVKPDQKMEKPLRTSEMESPVDPMAEWKQIFTDAWRLERDYFYDPNMHGVDWSGMRKRYGALLQDAVTRYDVNFVIGELIGELNSSHSYRGGGDLEAAKEVGVGLLGVDYALENGAYRIKRIVSGAPWDSEVRSPLREPGINVKEGDYLLAVNGAPLDVHQDPWAAFQGLAGKAVSLTVNDKPSLEGARNVVVETLTSELRLRNLAWIEANRRKVDEATGGRAGYIYVPDTGTDGQTELVRQYRWQFDKPGLVIDERFNSGGQIPDRFVEMLGRPRSAYWAIRYGKDFAWPPLSHLGPEVMLINGWSGSGGDCFPYFFRQAKLGPLIGRRTWGGLIGISGAPELIDGGGVTVPSFSFYTTEGKWAVEGHGVDPDIDVVDDPALMTDGGDPQLDRAIQEILSELAKNPPREPGRPAYTDRSGR
jgi:tricorn protease